MKKFFHYHLRGAVPDGELRQFGFGKWAIPILYRLMVIDGPIRFSELQRAVAPIAQKELTRQLRQFEQCGLVTRQVFPEVPPRVEYQITPLGKTLRPTLDCWPLGCVTMRLS